MKEVVKHIDIDKDGFIDPVDLDYFLKRQEFIVDSIKRNRDPNRIADNRSERSRKSYYKSKVLAFEKFDEQLATKILL